MTTRKLIHSYKLTVGPYSRVVNWYQDPFSTGLFTSLVNDQAEDLDRLASDSSAQMQALTFADKENPASS